MADEQIVTSIVAKADLSSLVSEVHRATTSLQTLQRELVSSNKSIAAATKVANNAFKDTLVGSGLFSSHFVNLTSDVEKFGKQLDGGRLKLKDYFSTFRTHLTTQKGLIRELAKEQVMLQNSILQPLGRNAQGLMQFNALVPRGLDAVANKAKLANMEMQIMNRALSEGATSLINWGKNTQWAGRQLTVGLTVPITMFGTAAARAFREADQELTRLTKVYGGLTATSSAELAQVRKDVTETARTLSSSYGATFKETLSLAADIAATGKTGNELLGSIKETTRLAVLGEVDRQEAMKATLAIQTAFKQNTDELGESINFLNAVENQTSTTLQDLVEAIPKAGPVIKGLGGSVKDLALYLTAMREGGISASEGANALKSGLASLINPTKVAVAQFRSLGIDILGIVEKNAGNVTGTLLELQSALDKLNPLQKQQAIEQLFGKFQFARMNALFENLGKQGSQTLQVLDLMKASSEDLAKVASRELKMVTESASGKYKRALETLKADLAKSGDRFLDLGTKFMNLADKLIRFFEKLPEPIKKAVTYLGGFTAVIGPIIMLTGVLANFFGYITKGAVSLRAFFQGQKGWKMLTPEMIAAENAAKLVEKSFYSDAAAAEVLHAALNKLITDYASLRSSMQGGAIPVNPTVGTVGGSTIFPGMVNREVDPANVYAGAADTRAMSHINPRDINNPATLMGVVPGAIPVNRAIGKTPQIYMNDRLPNIEGVTSVGGVSTGIVAGEAARFHAVMATLGMQTQAEVDALKKTIALGGTVSHELLGTFDDILPITQTWTQKAANESAIIVEELQSAKITVDQAKARIIALNAEIDAMMRADISAYAASRGRTIDFTKAPLMNQPVVDANAQFTLRDLYKKENNKAVMEEFGRLRGIKTYGAPYSIHVTRLPRFETGGAIEGFGPGKTTVSGPTSVNYDDRLGSVPLGGYVLNQGASLDSRNQDLVAMAPYTYADGGEITAALTPGEVVFGPKIHEIPGLYDAVHAANNGYNFGGQILRNKGNYGKKFDETPAYYKKVLGDYVKFINNPFYEESIRMRAVMNDAAVFMEHAGMSPEKAIDEAYKIYNTAQKGRPSLETFVKRRVAAIKKMEKQYPGLQRSSTNPRSPVSLGLNKHISKLKETMSSDKRFFNVWKEIEAIRGGFGINSAGVPYLTWSNRSGVTEGVVRAHLERYGSLEPTKGFAGSAIVLDAEINSLMNRLQQRNMGIDIIDYRQPQAKQSLNLLIQKAGMQKLTTFDDIAAALSDPGNKFKTKAELEEIKQGVRKAATAKQRQDLRMLLEAFVQKKRWVLRGRPPVPQLVSFNKGGGIPGYPTGGPIIPPWVIRNEKVRSLANTDPLHGPLQIGRYRSPLTVRNRRVGASVEYRGNYQPWTWDRGPRAGETVWGPRRTTAVQAFLTGSPEDRARYITEEYMRGNYDVMNLVGSREALRSIVEKVSGNFHRGITLNGWSRVGGQMRALPKWLTDEIILAQKTGDFSKLIGKEFIMRRSSWSSNKETASGFGDFLISANVKNRNAVRASHLFPELDFMTPGSTVKVNEAESYFGGKFKITGINKNGMTVNAVTSKNRGGSLPAYRGGGHIGAHKKYYGIRTYQSPDYDRPDPRRVTEPRRLLGNRIDQHLQAFFGRRTQQPISLVNVEIPQTMGYNRRTGDRVFGKGQPIGVATPELERMAGILRLTSMTSGLDRIFSKLEKPLSKLTHALLTTTKTVQGPGKGFLVGLRNQPEFTGRPRPLTPTGLQRFWGGFNNTGYAMGLVNTPNAVDANGRPIYNRFAIGAGDAYEKNNIWGAQRQALRAAGRIAGQWKAMGLTPDGQEIMSRKKAGYLGFRGKEFSVGGQVLTAEEARAAGLRGGFGLGQGAQMGMMMGGQVAGMALMQREGKFLGMSAQTAGLGVMTAASILPFMMGKGGALSRGFAGAKTWVTDLGKAANGTKIVAKEASMLGKTLSGAGKAGNVLWRILNVAKFVAPIGAIITAVTTLGEVWKRTNNYHQDAVNRFGLTKKAAEELGVEYFKLADRMKAVTAQQQAQRAAAVSGAQVGVPGLMMDPKKMEELKKSAGQNFKESIESINRANPDNINQLINNLKANMIGLGVSAEEANKNILGMMMASEKSNLSFKVFSDQGFASITDRATAAKFIFQNLRKEIDNPGHQFGTKMIEGFSSLVNITDQAINNLKGTKDAQGNLITEADAFKQVMDQMKNIPNFDQAIGDKAFKELPKEFQAIASSADSVGGAIAKWRLYLQNVPIDLKKISSQTAILMETFNASFDTAVTNLEKAGGNSSTFGTIGGALNKLNSIIQKTSSSAQRAAAASQRSAQEEIKLINKKIQAIQDEADAKLKALKALQDKQSYETDIQKAQLDYQDAVARGDMAAAARAQLNIQQLTKQRQLALAEQAIQDEAARKQKVQQAKATAIQNQQDKVAAAYSAAQDNAGVATSTKSKIDDFATRYSNLLRTRAFIPASDYETANANRSQLDSLIKEIQKAGLGKTSEAKYIREAFSELFTTSGAAKDFFGTDKSTQDKLSSYTKNLPPQIASALKDFTTNYSRTGLDALYNRDLATVSNEADKIIKGLGGNATLATIVAAIKGDKGAGGNANGIAVKSASQYIAAGARSYTTTTYTVSKKDLIAKGVKSGGTFIGSDNNTYTAGVFGSGDTVTVTRKAMGGRFVPGRYYKLNDGGKIEGIKFDMPGTIYPNINTMPRYEVGGPIKYNKTAYGNPMPATTNNSYVINVQVDGSNLSGDEIAAAIEKKMRNREIAIGGGRTN